VTDSLDHALHAVVTVADLVRDGRLGRVRVQIGDLSIDVTAPVSENPPRAVESAPVEVATQTELPPVQVVVAPLMGVFFRAPAPDRPPFVAVAERVEVGQQIAVIEAMKMEAAITAPVPGKVRRLAVAGTARVEAGDLIVEIA